MQTTPFKKLKKKEMECTHCGSGRRTNKKNFRRHFSRSSSSFNVVLIFVCFLNLIIYANCKGIAWSKPNAWSEVDLDTGRVLHVWETAANNAYSLLFGGLSVNGYVTTDTYILWHGGSKKFGKDIEQPYWEILPGTAPSPGTRFAAAGSAVGENEILIFGGAFNYNFLSDTWIFNGEKKTWRRAGLLSSAPVPGLKYAQIARISNKSLIMFGGIREESGMTSFETATWKFSYDKDAWEKFEGSNNIPPLREYHRMIWTNIGPLVFGGRKGNIYYKDCWIYSEPDGWKEIKPKNNDTLWPSATASMSMDSNSDGTKILMAGGNGRETENDKMTWIFSTATKTWEQILPPKSSSSDYFFVERGNLAFLSPNGFVLIGGFYNSNIINYPRTFDLEQKLWRKINSIDTQPPPLKKHVSTEIVGTDCVLIHGGMTGNNLVFYQHAWKYCTDKKSWQFLDVTHDSEDPGPRINHGMVSFAPQRGIIFGGWYENKYFDTTYIFTLPYNGYISWTKINSDYSPSKRSQFGMVLIKRSDKSKNVACLFGGISGGGRVTYGDTWCFDDSTNKWTEIVAADKVKPPSRNLAGIASYSTNKMLIFGGLAGPKKFNDLWEFNYEKQQWRDLTPLAKKNSGNLIPSKRYLPLLARLQTFNAFILFGGKNNVPFSDTWMLWFDLDGQPYWKLITLPISPPASMYATASSIDVPVEKIYPTPTNPDVVTFGGPEVVIFGGELLWNVNSDATTVFVNSECPPGTQAINRTKSNGCELCPIGFYKESAQVGCTSCLKGVSTTRQRGSERKSDCDICETHEDSAGVCALEESDKIKSGAKQVWSCFPGVWGNKCQYRCPGFEESKAGSKQINICGPRKFSGICSEGPMGTGKLNEKENLLLQKDIELREEKIAVQKAQEGWKIQEGEIIFSKKIGKGSFSNVYVGTWSPLKNVPVAIKVMKDENATIFDDTETLLLQRLRHPRLVLFFGTGILKKEKKIFLVSEYMSGGDLMNFIRKAASSGDYNTMYPWKKRITNAMDIAEGMNFLHSQGWVHRDLKSANVLIHSNGQCKITDFGLSKSLTEINKEKQTAHDNNKKKKELVISVIEGDEKHLRSRFSSFNTEDGYKSIEMTSFTGSAPWLAPELITKRSRDVATGGKPVDVYSFACVLYELVEGRIPWSTASSQEDIFQRVESGLRPSLTPIKIDNLTRHDDIGTLVNKNINRLMISCWDHIPSKRPTFSKIIEELATVYHDNFIGKQQRTNRRKSSTSIQNKGKHNMHVAIIGTGVSGIGAIKGCLQAGLVPTAFESDKTFGGFWRYKEDTTHPSVYRCCHIDTDRDLAGYADYPWDPNHGLLISNEDITSYLEENVKAFNLKQYIKFNTKVENITCRQKNEEETSKTVWSVETADGNLYEFDAVIVATGRHGGGAYIPSFKNMNQFQGQIIHSSKYKYPEKHHLQNKSVVVVGCGNSGVDCITDICGVTEKAYWISRSGVWINSPGHAEDAFSKSIGETLVIELIFRLPWWIISTLWETFGVFVNQDMVKDQSILNKHGLKPKHRLFQQHYGIMTGEFTKNGVVFTDDPNKVIPIDCVIMATGFKQHCEFVDPDIVDLRWHRAGNDVPLYQGVFPIHKYGNRIAFINMIQSVTFLAADLQVRLATGVFKDEIKLPSLKQQFKHMKRTRDAMCTQHMDRQQLRVQHGGTYPYYREITEMIGCYPSFYKLITERPTAIWHAWGATWNPAQYRLVGPGRLERSEHDIEEMHRTRFYGIDPRTGKRKNGPLNRGFNPFGPLPREYNSSFLLWLLEFPMRHLQMILRVVVPVLLFIGTWLFGYSVSYVAGDHLEDNLRYMERYERGRKAGEKGDVTHALVLGEDPKDVKEIGSRGKAVWVCNNLKGE
eukprot:g8642.t1